MQTQVSTPFSPHTGTWSVREGRAPFAGMDSASLAVRRAEAIIMNPTARKVSPIRRDPMN